MSLCKAATAAATSRPIVGLLDGGQPDKDFFHICPDLLQSFLQILDVSMIDAACFVRSFGILVQVVGADSQERNQGFHILQIQSNAVTIQSHFPQIGSHAAGAKLVHLLMDSLDLLLR